MMSQSKPDFSPLTIGAALVGAGAIGALATSLFNKRRSRSMKKPKVVVVTGAAGQIGYSLIFMIAKGLMLGKDQPIELRLLDLPQCLGIVKGVIMELEDCAYPLLHKVVATSDTQEAFQDAEFVLLVGARPRGPGMDRKDLLKANAAIFEAQGKALNEYASRNVKILVVGNPANTNARITMAHAPNLPKTAFSAMTRLDQNRATALLASRLRVGIDDISNVIVWGNHSNTQYPDVNYATVRTEAGIKSVRGAVSNDEYLNGDFIKTVQGRGAAIINALQKSSAASAANAAVDHMRDWYLGTKPGQYVSMAIASDGSYGVRRDLIFSFPVTTKNGEYQIVQGLDIDSFSSEKLKQTEAELIQEEQDAGIFHPVQSENFV